MKRNYKKAYTKLVKMGCPVLLGDDYGNERFFRISAEDNDDTVWADYYQMDFGDWGVNQIVVDVLSQNGLYAEWINPGVLGVHEC
tara:strand:- start:10644 stop:10898 length:255 start_codon:yes stop_codon:yes gene_type:complete